MGSDPFDNDVSGVYSPPRTTRRARRHGLRAGWSLDIMVMQDDGSPWDLGKPVNRARAIRLLKRKRPRLLIGSPMSTFFSCIMKLNRAKMGEENFQRQFLEALEHLEFACKLYEIQARQGGWFLHEHPAATS